MRRSRRYAKNFTNYLFSTYGVPRIPVIIHWGYDVVETPVGCGFGVYMERTDGTDRSIHIAAGKYGTSCMLKSIAHEFVHYLQHLHDRSFEDGPQIEADADYWANALYNQWRINKKDKRIRIEGISPIWTESSENAPAGDDTPPAVSNGRITDKIL